MPNAPLTFVQILIGVADLGLSAIGMYVLLPANPPIELLPFIVIFVLATLLGFLSHTPGALGVFDAAILIALVQYPKEDLLATLLVWRAIYYILPFSLALVVMATRELWLAHRRRAGLRASMRAAIAGPGRLRAAAAIRAGPQGLIPIFPPKASC